MTGAPARDPNPAGRLVSVNVARMRTIELNGVSVETGIYKHPVPGRLAVRGTGLEGDRQADTTVHGGYDKAIYAYATADYAWWSAELGRDLEPGTFGENLTVEGIDASDAVIGERWRVGSCLLEASEPRLPCSKLGKRMDDPRFVKRFARALRPGAYLRIIEEGELGVGDPIEVVDRPAHEVTMRLMARVVLGDHEQAPRLLAVDALAERWREWAARRSAC